MYCIAGASDRKRGSGCRMLASVGGSADPVREAVSGTVALLTVGFARRVAARRRSAPLRCPAAAQPPATARAVGN